MSLARPLTRPLTRALTGALTEWRGGGAPAFTVPGMFATLVAAGEPTAWYDPSDLTSTYQTTGTGTPAIATNPVGRVSDKSGSNNHLLQATAGERPTLIQSGAVTILDMDGTDDNLLTAAATFRAGMSVFMVVEPDVGEATWASIHDASGTSRIAGTVNSGDGSTPQAGAGTPSYWVNDARLNAGGVGATSAQLYTALTGKRSILEIRSVDFSTWLALGIGGKTGFALLFNGKLGEVMCLPDPGAATRSSILSYLAAKWGVTLTTGGNIWTAALGQEGTAVESGNTYRAAAFSRAAFTTTATSITIGSWNSTYGAAGGFCELGLRVDGVFQEISPAGLGPQTNVIPLAGGTKTIEVTNGPTTRPSASVDGTWLTYVSGDAPITRVDLPPGADVVIYGDSISIGGNVTVWTRDAYTMLLRARLARSVGVEAFGYRALHDDCVDSTARAAFVKKIVRWNPSTLVMLIGTNDYGLNRWSAAAYGTAYAALLDALHVALPALQIKCVTPLYRTDEGANGSGSTLPDYRAQITTAVATRGSYCTLIDGQPIITSGDLADNVHPSVAGHVKVADALEAVI